MSCWWRSSHGICHKCCIPHICGGPELSGHFCNKKLLYIIWWQLKNIIGMWIIKPFLLLFAIIWGKFCCCSCTAIAIAICLALAPFSCYFQSLANALHLPSNLMLDNVCIMWKPFIHFNMILFVYFKIITHNPAFDTWYMMHGKVFCLQQQFVQLDKLICNQAT